MHSDFLFAQPSGLAGWARLLDLFGTFDDYNTSPSRSVADARALYTDWVVTGEDIRVAMAALKELKHESTHDPRRGETFRATGRVNESQEPRASAASEPAGRRSAP